MTSPIQTEEHKVPGATLVAKAKELIHQGNVRRLIVKNDQGQTVIEVPLTAGVVGCARRSPHSPLSGALQRWPATTRSSSSSAATGSSGITAPGRRHGPQTRQRKTLAR